MLPVARCEEITRRFSDLSIAVVGDFCLDRYLEIDFDRQEFSIETGLPVWNAVNVRAQPGGCGTVVSNLHALGVGRIIPVGFRGLDGEGWELEQALKSLDNVVIDHLFATPYRRTFTYTKPLDLRSGPGSPPRELNRIDLKNWSRTPERVSQRISASLECLATEGINAMIVLDQCDQPNFGVITDEVLSTIDRLRRAWPDLFLLGDSRSGLERFPPIAWKMNLDELSRLLPNPPRGVTDPAEVLHRAAQLAADHGAEVCVTLAEQGLVAAGPTGERQHVPCLPVRGQIDVVGAGDAVAATYTAVRAAGGSLEAAAEIANAAAHLVIHQLGTTGTATPDAIRSCLA